jgi:hypothetical protein
VITEAAASIFTIEDIQFTPKNEGEAAIYSFEFFAPSDIASDSTFIIWFPEEFGPRVHNSNDDLECWATPTNFVGDLINCTHVDDRKIHITGFNTISSGLDF